LNIIIFIIFAFFIIIAFQAVNGVIFNGRLGHCNGKVKSRVRKNWKCCSCKRWIKAGEVAFHSGANRRELGRVYMCSDCKNNHNKT